MREPRSAFGRHRPRAAVRADRDIGEGAFRHFNMLFGGAPSCPALDLHRDRGTADLYDIGVAAHFIPNEYGKVKGHAGDRHRRNAPSRPSMRNDAAGQVHLRKDPAAEDVAGGISVRRHRNGAQRRLTPVVGRSLVGHLDLLINNKIWWALAPGYPLSCLEGRFTLL